ncbi:hypothetical protein JCM5176_12790 [Streptococcus sobrinus]
MNFKNLNSEKIIEARTNNPGVCFVISLVKLYSKSLPIDFEFRFNETLIGPEIFE